jgi:hypothetical protein
MVLGVVLLVQGAVGRVWALEAEAFEGRLTDAMQGVDRDATLRALDSLGAEALQAGRLDLRALATAAHARVRLRGGAGSRVRRDLDEALLEARAGGWAAVEAVVCDVFGDYWLAQGDPPAAAEWLDLAWSLALAPQTGDVPFALRILGRLEEIRQNLGQPALAAQAQAWRALLTGAPDAPEAEISLQPMALTTQVATDEVGRVRLFLANATPVSVSGTLLVDGGDLAVGDWKSHRQEESITLQFPAISGAVPQSATMGRKLSLRPGETRTLTLEVEPDDPPRPGARTVSITWQSGEVTTTSTAQFYFRRGRELPGTSVANSCQVRLSPLLSVPVHMEVYHRGRPTRHIQDLLPATSRPCRIEVQELLSDGATGRQWLAVDADGDGAYHGSADAVVMDANGSGFPDVEFSADKQVAALELRLYPLPADDGRRPESLELMVSLRDGERWREPADVRHLIEVPAAE